MNKKIRKNYYIGIIVYVLVRLAILFRDKHLSVSYFLNEELSGVIGFIIGYTLLYYLVIMKETTK